MGEGCEPRAQCRGAQPGLPLPGSAGCLKNQVDISDESFRQEKALQQRARHSLQTKNRALLIKEADVKPRAGGGLGG